MAVFSVLFSYLRSAKSFLRSLGQSVRLWTTVIRGFLVYLYTGKTPAHAYQIMIFLYCKTRGWSNDFLHFCVKLVRRPYKLPHAQGVLGNLSAEDVKSVVQSIRDKGYYVFPQALSPDICEKIAKQALLKPAKPIGIAGLKLEPCLYDPTAPATPMYLYNEKDLLSFPEVQALFADMSFLAVAQEYLGSQPVLDVVSMWWSTSGHKEASGDAAQLYHFDMDRIKWLRFFIYLTDVTPRNGPHCFVAGSHKTYGQPAELLQKGYARISDDEIAMHYPKEALMEFTGLRGTIIAEDTRGFHKGKVLEEGSRLLIELDFTNCLFGGDYQKIDFPQIVDKQLEENVRAYPRVFSKYLGKTA